MIGHIVRLLMSDHEQFFERTIQWGGIRSELLIAKNNVIALTCMSIECVMY